MNILEESKYAISLIANKKYEEAEKIYLNLINQAPNNTTILAFTGLLYLQWNKINQAEEYFDRAYSIETSEMVTYNLAIIKEQLAKKEEALILYKELLNINQKIEYYIKITNLLINLTIFNDKNKYLKELDDYTKKGLNLYPRDKNIILNYSIGALYNQKKEEGEKYCKQALKMDPQFSKAWAHLGLINEYVYSNEIEAQNCYKKAIKYNKNDNKPLYYDIAISYSKTNDFKKALYYFHKALKLDPNNKTILLGMAQCYFKQRKFKMGYKYYTRHTSIKYPDLKHLWDGKTHKDKTLFIYSDLGYGDQILYIRYLPYVAKKFKKVKIFVFSELYELFKENYKEYPNIEFIKIETGIKYPEYDYSIVLSNLPYAIKKDFRHIPFSNKYINSEKTKTDIKNIGICWQAGNSDIRTTIHRNIEIKEFEPIINIEKYNFFSLQVGATIDEYKQYKNLKDLAKDFKDFTDTAEALKNIDLLITVDTSIANLAGAMGIKTFMLIPTYSDWRWFDNTEKTEWYDSITIFKQKIANSWIDEIKQIEGILNNQIAQ